MRKILVSAVLGIAIFSAAAAVFAPAFHWASGAQEARAEGAQPSGAVAPSKTATAAVTQNRKNASGARWGAHYFPNLPVVTQDGKTGKFYDDFIKDRLVVISFIYTSCTDLCPLTSARISMLQDKLGKAVGRDVFFISMSVDPAHDTPERLKAFADAFDAGPGWTFLTGKPEDINAINYKLGDRSSRQLSDHRNEIVIGHEPTGQWARDSVFGELDRLAITILGMDPEWSKVVREPGKYQVSDKPVALGEQPGQSLFRKICSPCHTIGVGDKVGPDLRDVSARRDRAWLLSFIRDPKAKRTAKDPTALELVSRFPAVRMPVLGLSENDAADVISYLDTQSARIADLGENGPKPAAQHHQH